VRCIARADIVINLYAYYNIPQSRPTLNAQHGGIAYVSGAAVPHGPAQLLSVKTTQCIAEKLRQYNRINTRLTKKLLYMMEKKFKFSIENL